MSIGLKTNKNNRQMKHRISFFAILMMALAIPRSVFAYDFSALAPSGQTLYYDINGFNVTVTYQNNFFPHYSTAPTGALLIPDTVTYGGITYTVTAIGHIAFANCNELTSVTIPNTITSIGSGAFENCSGLTSISIPNSVTNIGDMAFSHCSSLTSILVASGNTYYDSRNNCNAIIETSTNTLIAGCQNTIIPNTVTIIGNSAFSGCFGLISVTIPNSVTAIRDQAFADCRYMTYVNIPNSVISIGNGAFLNCRELISVTIPDSVISIGFGTFGNCIGLTSISIGSSVDSIGEGAFEYCSGLTSITIPQSVISIGNQAFRGCTGLMEVTSQAVVAPTLGYLVFEDVPGNIPIIIPCGSMASYQSVWSYFSNFFEPIIPSVSTWVENNNMGYATILTGPNCDSVAVIKAIANHGYHFTSWNDGDTNNPRTVTLTQDSTFTAFFNKNRYLVTCMPDDTLHGTVSGGDSAFYLDTLFLTASANYGYSFSHWYQHREDGTERHGYGNPIITVVTDDMVVTAYFEAVIFDVTTVQVHGDVIIDGDRTYLSTVTLTAIPSYGYHFSTWNDGDTNNPRYFTLTQDTSFSALFTPNQYTLSVIAGEHGTVTGGGTFNYGDSITIQAYPEEHYHFVRWNDGNTDNPRQYSVVADRTLTALFEIDSHTVIVTTNNIERGMTVATGSEFAYGTPCTVTAIAYSGYCFSRWSNGVTYNPYTFAVLNDIDLMAIFVPEDSVGINDVETEDAIMYSRDGMIVVESEGTRPVRVFDAVGRIVQAHPATSWHPSQGEGTGYAVTIDIPASGVYLVKIGDLPARKIVVVR